jgi:hypothetical protein
MEAITSPWFWYLELRHPNSMPISKKHSEHWHNKKSPKDDKLLDDDKGQGRKSIC